jgi:hypothetical protein
MLPTRLFSLILTLFYLSGPLLVVVELFKRALSIPLALLFAAYIALGTSIRRDPPVDAKASPLSGFFLGFVAFLLCVVWVYYSGIGGFALCRWDYEKHNVIFSYLLDQKLPIYTSLDRKEFIVHYSFAYYITPVRLYQMAHVLAPGVSLNAILLVLYSVVLFFAAAVLSRGRMAFLLVLLAVLSLTGGLDAIGMLAFGVEPHGKLSISWLTFNIPSNLEWWGLPYAPQGFTTNLYYAPQHFFAALIGTALLLQSLQSQRPAAATLIDISIVVAASVFWSPYVAAGLLILATVLDVTLGDRGVLARLKREGLSFLLTPHGLTACAFAIALALAAVMFVWGAKPLSAPRLVVQQGSALQWLLTYILNYAPFLIALLLVLLTSPRQSPVAQDGKQIWCPALPKILVGCLTASAAVLLLRHGLYNDWAMRVTLPLSIALAVAMTYILFGGLKWPYLAVLLTVLALSSASSLAELTRSLLMPTKCASYGAYRLEDIREIAPQYEGRVDSFLYQYLARQRRH